YQQVIDEFPTSPRVPEALYAMGNIEHDRKKNSKRAVELFRNLVSSFPDHATASNALFLTGFIYNNELKNYDSAKVAYEQFIRLYPKDHLVNDAKFELEHLGMDPAEIIKDKIERDVKANPRKPTRTAKK
ncbi:MAG: tetratricopeptide repeat protein, partial [Bacteroidota bacterium]